MGIGKGVGEGRAVTAAKTAIESPLLEISINGARGILFNITGGQDMTMAEVNEAAQIISQAADPDANIIFGAAIDDSMGDELKISVIATGFDEHYSGAKLYGTTLTRSISSSGMYMPPQPAAPSMTTDDSSEDLAQPQPVATTNSTSAANPLPEPPAAPTPKPAPPVEPVADSMDDEFDIPAFLRRK